MVGLTALPSALQSGLLLRGDVSLESFELLTINESKHV